MSERAYKYWCTSNLAGTLIPCKFKTNNEQEKIEHRNTGHKIKTYRNGKIDTSSEVR